MQIGSSAYATQGTVASDTAPYYLPSGVTSFVSLSVNDLTVTNDANINTALVNNNLLVNGAMYGNIVTPNIQSNEDIALTATTGGITLSASADAGTSVFRRFGLFDCMGSPTSPATLSTAPYNMPTSKGFFEGTVGDSGVYVFNVNPSFNPNPFAIIQTIDGSPTNVSGWSITAPGQITVTGPGGGQVAKFSIIIL